MNADSKDRTQLSRRAIAPVAVQWKRVKTGAIAHRLIFRTTWAVARRVIFGGLNGNS